MKHVFITGCPRSGTTMLASMLGSCQNCITTPESDFFLDYIYKNLNNDVTSVKKESFRDYLNNNYRFKQWQLNADEIKDIPGDITLSNFDAVIENVVKSFAENNSETVPKENDYIRIDHTPYNIKSFRVLNELFPESKFVFVMRDPRAIFASIKELDWGANTALKLSNIWIEFVALLYSLKEICPGRIYLVKYEDIVLDPDLHIEKVCSYLGVEYKDSIIEGGGFTLPSYTASQHKLVGKRPVKDRIYNWKDKLSKEDVMVIESKCGLMMKAFSYDCSYSDIYRVTGKVKLNSWMKEAYYYFINKYRKYKRSSR